MQLLNWEDCKCRPPGTSTKKYSSLWWSLPRLDRSLIQCKQCLELSKCAKGIGHLPLQRALIQLLLGLWSLVIIFIAVTGASFKDGDLPIAVCRVARIGTCYMALNLLYPRCMCPRGAGFKIYSTNHLYIHSEQNKSCLFTARSKLILTTSQSSQKIMRLLEIWEISQDLRWWSQMMPSRCNFWMGRKNTSRSNGFALALHKGSP